MICTISLTIFKIFILELRYDTKLDFTKLQIRQGKLIEKLKLD